MIRFLLIAVLGLCLLAGIVRADESATEQLLASLAPVDQLEGHFQQRQYGLDNELVVQSSGSFRLLRPGYFSWEILSPDSQLIIADPEHLWHLDRDLETVTRRPVAGSGEMSPLQVLGGDESVLRERFQVSVQEEGRFTLTPLAGDPGFQHLTLQFQDELIAGMEILDNLNQRVEIDFSSVVNSGKLTPADFAFSPPEGADLFYYDE